ncbi:MAG: hypothetical protein BGO11_02745 [Solirubrobacterales bacterium 70-9]|nr:MAG: hypothetical protein BGO11_02745 [Solirubrobacterales bacterium 70-9]
MIPFSQCLARHQQSILPEQADDVGRPLESMWPVVSQTLQLLGAVGAGEGASGLSDGARTLCEARLAHMGMLSACQVYVLIRSDVPGRWLRSRFALPLIVIAL